MIKIIYISSFLAQKFGVEKYYQHFYCSILWYWRKNIQKIYKNTEFQCVLLCCAIKSIYTDPTVLFYDFYELFFLWFWGVYFFTHFYNFFSFLPQMVCALIDPDDNFKFYFFTLKQLMKIVVLIQGLKLVAIAYFLNNIVWTIEWKNDSTLFVICIYFFFKLLSIKLRLGITRKKIIFWNSWLIKQFPLHPFIY